MNFKEKMAQIQKKVSVSKDWKNPFFKSNYITLDNILASVNKLLEENKILLVNRNIENGVETILQDLESKESESSIFTVEWIRDPQKLWACITYWRRYNLVSLLNIVADKDSDGNDFYKCLECWRECQPWKKYCSKECFDKSKNIKTEDLFPDIK